MKSIIKNNYLTLFFCVMVCLLSSCSDKEDENTNGYQQLYSGWWDIDHEGDDDYDYDEYQFFEDGVGTFSSLKKTPDSPSGFAKSDYCKVFTFMIENDMLIFDYGFGYIQRYRIESISKEYLHLSLSGSPVFLARRDGASQRYLVPDYFMKITNATWDIKDTKDKYQEYVVSLHSDGTYESKSYSNVSSTSFITETGKFEVQSSRVRFQSDSNGSLLNGRIFMITWGGKSNIQGTNGKINLETENGTKIIGYQI